MEAKETRQDNKYTYEQSFYLNIYEQEESSENKNLSDKNSNKIGDLLDKKSLIKETSDPSLQPYVEGFDAKGEMTIGWSYPLAPQSSLDEIETSTFKVRGQPLSRNL